MSSTNGASTPTSASHLRYRRAPSCGAIFGCLVMSATLDGAPVAALLGDAPIVTSEGRSFPVETRYSAPRRGRGSRRRWPAPCAWRWKITRGTSLAFLPGAAEIGRTAILLSRMCSRRHPRFMARCPGAAGPRARARASPAAARWSWRPPLPRPVSPSTASGGCGWRPRARAALLAPQRNDPPCDCARVPRVGRPAAGQSRPAGARRLLSPVGRIRGRDVDPRRRTARCWKPTWRRWLSS